MACYAFIENEVRVVILECILTVMSGEQQKCEKKNVQPNPFAVFYCLQGGWCFLKLFHPQSSYFYYNNVNKCKLSFISYSIFVH